MGHAAEANDDFDAMQSDERSFAALLRLRQGGSARATWVVEESAGGTMISVGTDPACDWQIRAAFVPPRAFSILVVGGRAFVRSGPEPGLLLNGKPVEDGWNQVQQNDRIDIGLARLEVTMGYGDLLAQQPVIQLGAGHPRAVEQHEPILAQEPARAREPVLLDRPRSAVSAVQEQPLRYASDALRTPGRRSERGLRETHEYGETMEMRKTIPMQQRRPRNSTIELRPEDLDYVGTIPMPRVHDGRYDGESSGEYAVSPSLLESEESTRVTRPKRWRYAAMGAFFAASYGGWLYLLDRM